MRTLLILGTLLCLLSSDLFGQHRHMGLPPIINYEKKDYQAETQNWAVSQDERGLIYMGNNSGLLEFDGSQWRCFPLPNKSILRSLAISSDGRIFVGGQDEIGYFEANAQGRPTFHSLKNRIPPKYRDFADVWKVFLHQGGVYGCTHEYMFYLKDSLFTCYQAPERFDNFFYLDGKLRIDEASLGLLVLEGDSLKPMKGGRAFQRFNLRSILQGREGELLIFTEKEGILTYQDGKIQTWGEEVQDFLKKNRIYTAIKLSDASYAVGTSLKGLLILDEEGKPTWSIDRAKGLLNNSVLSLFQDRADNLWLGLENGICHIEIQSPFSIIDDRMGVNGSAYASTVFEGKLYLATNQGIYWQKWLNPPSPLLPGTFNTIPTAVGPTWSLTNLDGQLLAGQHNGTLNITDKEALSISPVQGAWKFIQLQQHPHLAIEGTYSGLLLFEKPSGSEGWTFRKRLDGFEASARVMVQDSKGQIWVSHPYRGVYRIKLSPSAEEIEQIQFYNSKHGFPSDLSINVSRINDHLVFTTEKGVYIFDEETEGFIPHESLNTLFKDQLDIRRLLEDEAGNIWFSTDKEFGMLRIEEGLIEKEVGKLNFNQLAKRLVKGFESISAVDPHNILIGTDKGFILYHPREEKKKQEELSIYIRQVSMKAEQDSAVFEGDFLGADGLLPGQPSDAIPHFDQDANDLSFAFSAAYYRYINEVKYQYKLEGEDNHWSEWSAKREKEYTNLKPGFYTFKVRAKNVFGVESPEATYAFHIDYPWYQSLWARLTLITTFLGLLLFTINLNNKRIKKSANLQIQQQQATHEKKENEYRQEVEKSEAEIFRLKNDKLKAEMAYKNKELGSYAMHLVQKSEILLTLKAQLEKLKKEVPEIHKSEVRELVKTIESDILLDEEWEKFEHHFDEVHEKFLRQLREKYPELTAKDKKLCAYLRMNLSTKEIAPLMGISVRGVEIGRYRLRKKLNLASETNLNEFMMSL